MSDQLTSEGIVVLHCSVPESLGAEDFDARMALLPRSFRESIMKYRRHPDRVRSLAVKMLLQKAAEIFGLKELPEYRVDVYSGRPYILDQPEFDFSLSHSSEVAVCAASVVCRVGVDVEKIRPVDLELFGHVLSETELGDLRNSASPDLDFFKLWCAKEACAKADGRGMMLPMADLNISDGSILVNEQPVQVRNLPLAEGYSSSLAFTGSEEMPVAIREVKF